MASMWRKLFIIIATALMFHCFIAVSKQKWEYDFKELFSNSSNEDLVKVYIKLDRQRRNETLASGSVYLNEALMPGVTMRLETLYSRSGVGEYNHVPYAFENQTSTDFLNGYYKEQLMKTLKDCSNAPQFKDKFVQPALPVNYTFTKCRISMSTLPSFVPSGFYKVYMHINFPRVEVIAFTLVEVTPKI